MWGGGATGRYDLMKTCPAHGTSDVMVERNADFCRAATGHRGAVWTNSPSTIVEVTHRCNNRCPNCYHEEDRGRSEPDIQQVLGRVASIATPYICLVGGEPTVRRDLPALVAALTVRGRHISMYSNGIRLADKGYADELVAVGLKDVAFSMHHPEYSHPSIYAKKLAALDELAAARLRITHLLFSLQHAGQVPDILDFVERNRHRAGHFRIKVRLRARTRRLVRIGPLRPRQGPA